VLESDSSRLSLSKTVWVDDAHSGVFKLPSVGTVPLSPTNLRIIP
jgi:hypothetical protein